MDAILNSTLFNYLTVALGLGFVIFLHELGHFLVAKWNRVKVEMFSIGFGPALVAYRKGLGVRLGSTQRAYESWLAKKPEAADATEPLPEWMGETEYSIRAIPLGGFVKMLGEGDEVKTSHPRAYPNKSVGARMAIISAGVIMNAILGIVCFAWAYGQGGLLVAPARIGGVVAGQPAYEAGLRAGDEVVAINGRPDIDFETLQRMTAMSGRGEVLRLSVKRPGEPKPVEIDVEPRRQGDAWMKTMGIYPMPSLDLASTPFEPPASVPATARPVPPLEGPARLVAVGPQEGETTPVVDARDLDRRLAEWRDQPLAVVTEPEGQKDRANARTPKPSVLPVVPFVDLGFRLTMGDVAAIQPGSPAEKAGFRVGDRIVGVDSEEVIDPLRLADDLYAKAGQSVAFRVARSEGGKPEEVVTLTAVPRAELTWIESFMPAEPMEVAALGLAYKVVPTVTAIRADSPAARAGLRAGDRLRTIAIADPNSKEKPETRSLEDGKYAWPYLFGEMQIAPGMRVTLGLGDGKRTVTMVPEAVSGWNNPNRGLVFLTDVKPLPALGFIPAVRRGLEDTYDTILSIYAMFRSLAFGDISPKALGGPIMIADLASQTARAGLVSFLKFLGMLSLNLAVINFLPIPPLDGGQMTFLIAEKLRGKPLPESALNAGTIAGLVFVLGLMVFVFFQDVMRYFV